MILKEFGALGLPEEMAFIAWAETAVRSYRPQQGRGRGDVATGRGHRAQLQPARRFASGRAVRPAQGHARCIPLSRNLLAEFGEDSFMLAMASYNRGESGVRRVLHQIASEPGGFKEGAPRFLAPLPPEEASRGDARIRAKVLAAAIVSMNAQKYGLAGTKEDNDEVKSFAALRRFSPDKLQKLNLFETERSSCDVYCLEPGQEQKAHAHAGNDKVYAVLEGSVEVRVGGETRALHAGEAALCPAGASTAWRTSPPPAPPSSSSWPPTIVDPTSTPISTVGVTGGAAWC